jgi:hypothetical protein
MTFDRSKLKKTKAIVLYRQFVLFEFREIGMFLFEMDNVLTSKVREIEDFAKTMIDSSDREDTRNEVIDDLLDERHQLDTTFKQMLYNNSFISVFAMLENALQGICRHSLGTSFRIHKSNVIVNYKRDLEQAFEIDLHFGMWNDILRYREARNRLVHGSLQLTKQPESPMNQSLKDFLSEVGSVKFKADDTFVISNRGFIEKFCVTSEGYLKKTFELVVPLVKATE